MEYSIIVGVETWLTGDSNAIFSNCTSYPINRPNGNNGGGIIFIVKKHIDFQILQFSTKVPGLELGAIRVSSVSQPFNLAVCYRPPLVHLKESEWFEILSDPIIAVTLLFWWTILTRTTSVGTVITVIVVALIYSH